MKFGSWLWRGGRWFAGWLGVELDPVSGREKAISAAGAFLGILLVIHSGRALGEMSAPILLVASMGASAVLVFAVPHGQLSQPWPVLGGHGLSALIGVLCARHIASVPLAAACAVGLAIGAMHQWKCIHPPGGATALTAVIGGPGVRELGYDFVWCPVLVNAVVLVGIAVAFNTFFSWRRYPAFLNRPPRPGPGDRPVAHEEVVAALESFDSFVDISEEDLIRLHHLLSRRTGRRPEPDGVVGEGVSEGNPVRPV